jgi:thiamine-monophosphate kinase
MDNKPSTIEHQLIAAINDWTGGNFIGDDCAVLPGGTLVTADTLVEGNHFHKSLTSYKDLGWKAAAVNLSDIAAMGGRPRYMVVSLSLPDDFSNDNFRELYLSLIDCANTYRTKIVGGDLTSGRDLSISITVIGDVHESGCLRRQNAKDGYVVVVTGDFGASAAGLWALQNDIHNLPYIIEKHRRPHPRLCESWALVRRAKGRASAMDASDGLADALMQIGQASNVGIDIDEELLPIHDETRKAAALAGIDPVMWALYGGEDYELVACLPKDIWQEFLSDANNPFKAIGSVNASGQTRMRKGDGQMLALDMALTYRHWQKK